VGRAATWTAGDQGFQQHLREAFVGVGQPKGALGHIALPIAGDDTETNAVVIKLVDELGIDPVDGGGLDDSWR